MDYQANGKVARRGPPEVAPGPKTSQVKWKRPVLRRGLKNAINAFAPWKGFNCESSNMILISCQARSM